MVFFLKRTKYLDFWSILFKINYNFSSNIKKRNCGFLKHIPEFWIQVHGTFHSTSNYMIEFWLINKIILGMRFRCNLLRLFVEKIVVCIATEHHQKQLVLISKKFRKTNKNCIRQKNFCIFSISTKG